ASRYPRRRQLSGVLSRKRAPRANSLTAQYTYSRSRSPTSEAERASESQPRSRGWWNSSHRMCPSLWTERSSGLRRSDSYTTLVPERGQPSTSTGRVGGGNVGSTRESGRATRGTLRRMRQTRRRRRNARFVLTDGRGGGGRRSPFAP